MKPITLSAAVGAVLTAFAAPAAHAASTQTATVSSSFTINNSCTASTTGGMNFGSLASSLSVSQTDATGTLSIACTTGASVTLSGDAGLYANGSVSRMRSGPLNSGGFAYLNYGIYWDANRSQARASGSTSLATGTGAAQTVTIYGRLPAQTATAPGVYADTMTFTISF